jgi:hypothetical protein
MMLTPTCARLAASILLDSTQSTTSYPHYAWARKYRYPTMLTTMTIILTSCLCRSVGHVTVLLGTIYTLLGLVTFSSRSKSYYLSYTGAIISWGIVVVSNNHSATYDGLITGWA